MAELNTALSLQINSITKDLFKLIASVTNTTSIITTLRNNIACCLYNRSQGKRKVAKNVRKKKTRNLIECTFFLLSVIYGRRVSGVNGVLLALTLLWRVASKYCTILKLMHDFLLVDPHWLDIDNRYLLKLFFIFDIILIKATVEFVVCSSQLHCSLNSVE